MKIPPAKPYFPSEDMPKILEDIKGVLESGMLTLGKFTKEFEANYAKYCGTKYAIAVNSGTSALEIALRCLRIKPDDEVAHLELGFSYEKLGMYKEAIGAYKQARKIDPDFADYFCISHLLTLQRAEGGFEIDEVASAMLNVTVSQLRDIAESISIKLEADRFALLSTALIPAILRETFSDQIDIWREAVSESENWLKAEIERVKPTIKGIPLPEWIEEYIKELSLPI